METQNKEVEIETVELDDSDIEIDESPTIEMPTPVLFTKEEYEKLETEYDDLEKECDELDEECEKLNKEIAEQKNQNVRLAADFDNFRKRAKQETNDTCKRAQAAVIKEFLAVFDNLERAVDSCKENNPVGEGLKLVLDQYNKILIKLQLNRILTVDKAFDPKTHEAVQQIESADHLSGTVVKEIQAGFWLNGELLRPALVLVAK